LKSSVNKICVLALRRRGGSVRYATAMIDHLQDLEKDVYVSSYCDETTPHAAIKVKTYHSGLSFILSTMIFLPLLTLRLLPKLIRREYHILYLPYVHYWSFFFVPLFRIFRVNIISTIHDGVPHVGDGHWMDLFNARVCCRHSHRLVFLSEYAKDRVQEKIGFKSESAVIPHGVLDAQTSSNTNSNEVLRSYPNKFKLLFLGRILHYKGVDLLLEALPMLDPNKINGLTIAGKVDKNLAIHQHTPQVSWIDRWLEPEEMNQLLADAHILVLPYREATQSGLVTLGISTNIPMVCTRVGALPEQLSEDECVFADAHPEGLANGLTKLMNDAELYEKCQSRLIEKKKNLCWSKDGERLKSLFDSIQ
jgi:glycosyltransferase involved in cell wall biosynthesis